MPYFLTSPQPKKTLSYTIRKGHVLPHPQPQIKLLPVDLKVDYDRDGEDDILGDSGDIVPDDENFKFWINDDNDTGDDLEAGDEQSGNDSADNTIDCLRDLEDFTRLHVDFSALKSLVESDAIQVGLKFTETTGSPSIRLFHATDKEKGSNKYLTDEEEANKQKSEDHLFTVSSDTQWFPKTITDRLNSDGHLHLIFEGVNHGFGDLTLMIKPSSGEESEGATVPMRLTLVENMYEHWTAGDYANDSGGRNEMVAKIAAIPLLANKTLESHTYTDNSPETDDCIVFVHGWRIEPWERRKGFADVSYKRLWQSGFKGRFFHFSWPTGYTDRIHWIPASPPADVDNYPDSEHIAYNVGATTLKNFLTTLNGKYPGKVRMFAHSMGGIAASEALLQGAPIHTYAACQTAMAAHAYDATAADRPSVTWKTPEVYAKYPPTGNPYYQSVVSKTYNFYNKLDAALVGWETGQSWKPNDDLPIPEFYTCFYYIPSTNTGDFSYWGIPDDELHFPSDRYEIYSHAAQARSFALGARSLPGAKGNFNLRADLSDPNHFFTDHSKDHSGQFNGTMMIRYEFWEKLLEDAFNIPLNRP